MSDRGDGEKRRWSLPRRAALGIGDERLAARRDLAEGVREHDALRLEIAGEPVDLVEKGDEAGAEAGSLLGGQGEHIVANPRHALLQAAEIDRAAIGDD